MYYAAPGVGKGVLKLVTREKYLPFFEKKMYTVNINV